MLVLVALGEGAIRRFEPALNGIEPGDWRQTGRAASASPEVRSASVLCFGDSLVKLGLQPRILAAQLGEGRRAYNLALCAGRAPASYFLLRRALEAGAKPEAVVVDFNDSFLAEPPATTLRLYAELLRPAEVRDLARTMREPDFAATVWTYQGLGLARNRFELRRAVADLGAGRADFGAKAATSAAFRRNWRRNGGGPGDAQDPDPPAR